jgi:hypothetical protein
VKKTQNFPNNFWFKKSKSQTFLVGNSLKIGKKHPQNPCANLSFIGCATLM